MSPTARKYSEPFSWPGGKRILLMSGLNALGILTAFTLLAMVVNGSGPSIAVADSSPEPASASAPSLQEQPSNRELLEVPGLAGKGAFPGAAPDTTPEGARPARPVRGSSASADGAQRAGSFPPSRPRRAPRPVLSTPGRDYETEVRRPRSRGLVNDSRGRAPLPLADPGSEDAQPSTRGLPPEESREEIEQMPFEPSGEGTPEQE